MTNMREMGSKEKELPFRGFVMTEETVRSYNPTYFTVLYKQVMFEIRGVAEEGWMFWKTGR